MPEPDSGDNPRLLGKIRAEIRRQGPIPFDRFMELCLYDAEDGYYSSGPRRLGRTGDFVTASDAGPAFGRALARQVAEIDRCLGEPAAFDVLEFGPGRGLLARDVLETLDRDDPALAGRVRYWLVDRSAAMGRAAAEVAPRARPVTPDGVPRGARGCVLAVELFDALPVHRLRRRGGVLREICVGLDEHEALAEVEAEPSEAVRAWAARYGAAAEDGFEAEVRPAVVDQLRTISGALERGVLIVVDYGDPARQLYDRERRRGTLLAYRRHGTSEEVLRHVGEQDLTAHVDFTALRDAAADQGWTTLGLTTQDRFLIANGILEAFDQPDLTAVRDPARVKRRLEAMQLIHPSGMGRMFKVMLLSRGIDPSPRLAGLIDPFARD